MTHRKPITFLAAAAAVPLVALAAAGCGGGGGATAATLPPKTASGHAATVGAANEGSLGNILVDSQGHTLYLFKKDSGTKSACFGACATNWPPLRASGTPTVGGGASASSVGTTPRSDGTPQITYNGHPLYRFVGDKKPGDTNGQGLTAFGGGWFALSAAGNQVSTQSSGGSAGSGGVGGY
jgi:predicted lipoprotein with Yx(FWY)xxD motif